MASVSRIPERQEPVEQGVERVVEASRELVADALRLARLEAVSAARRAATAGLLVGAALAAFSLAWVAGAVALAIVLGRVLDPAAGVAAVAAGHLLLAVGCALVAKRRASPAEPRS